MQLIILIPALLIFLYALYRLVKDDYVFIRKGISLEQAFDIAFETLWSGLFFSRLFYLLGHFSTVKHLFLQFLSIQHGGFSLPGAIIGSIIAIYIISKSNRLPIGRLSDFLSIAFLYAMPAGFLLSTIFVRGNALLFLFLYTVIYFLVLLFFMQFLYPKLLNRTLKEGTLALLFLILFSLISLGADILQSLSSFQKLLSPDDISLCVLFFGSIFILIRQERTAHPKRTLTK